MARLSLDRILDLIERSFVESPASFEAAANGDTSGANWCADRMPESWIVAGLMKAAQEHGIAAMPEARVRHDLMYFESNGEPIRPETVPGLNHAGAKLDLLLADDSSLHGCIHLRVALEIKGPKSNWSEFAADIDRLRQLKAVVTEKDQALVFAYVTCPLLDAEREADAAKLERFTGLKRSDFRIRPALQDSRSTDGVRRSYVYMHIICGGDVA